MANVVVLGTKAEDRDESWRPDLIDGLTQAGCTVTALPLTTAVEVERSCRNADLLLWLGDRATKSGDYDQPGMRNVLHRLHDGGVVTAALHMDLYWGIAARERLIGTHPWWWCRYVFTADGGPRDWGPVNHHWFPPAFGTRYLGLFPDPGAGPDAVFVGSVSERIHGRDRAALLEWAKATYPRFEHYGVGDRKVWGSDLSRLYASADLVLGDSVDAPRYWSDRVVRVLGRAGILGHPHVEGFDEWGFTDEVMIRYPRNRWWELKERRDSMTAQQVRQMREAAVQLIAERHTWKAALTRVLKTVGL